MELKLTLAVCNDRRGPSSVENIHRIKHLLQEFHATLSCFVQGVSIQVDSSLAYILVTDLYPVLLRAVYITEEIVSDTLIAYLSLSIV